MSSKRLTVQNHKSDQRLLSDLALGSYVLSQGQAKDKYRVRIALVHVIAFSLSLAALFASGHLLPLVETKEKVGVGIIWTSDCQDKQEKCESLLEPSVRMFLLAGHVVGA